MSTTFQDALRQLRSAKTVVGQCSAGTSLKAMWVAALETIEDDVKREWNETNARRRAELGDRPGDVLEMVGRKR